MKTFGFEVNNDVFEKHSWYFRNALVRANYNDLKNGIYATTKFLEMFFSNLLLGTDYELKNRYMHIDYQSQSANCKLSKCQNDTLDGTLKISLNELALLKMIKKNPSITQNELAEKMGKSVRTIKREMNELKEKGYIQRLNGKRNGKWEVLIDICQCTNE